MSKHYTDEQEYSFRTHE